MSEQQYNIIFRGDIVFGFQLGDVKLRLQQLFKTDEAKINALFSGRPVAVKRNLDLPSAERYRAALLQAGAQVEIVAVDEAKAAVQPAAVVAVAPPPVAAPAAAPQPNEDWSLAPVGGNLLKATEQLAFVPRTIDTSSLGLRPVGGNLVEASEQPPAPQAQVVAPDFELASAGADLLRADEKLTGPALAIAENHWGLAAVGADLIEDEEREIVPHALIAVPDIGLAPAGADLGQLKPQVKPLVPDISGLHLLD